MKPIMEPVRKAEKKYCFWAMNLAVIAGFILIIAGQKSYGKGLILGTFFSVINFVLIGETISLRIGNNKRKTFILSFCSILFRYFLLSIPIFSAIKFSQFNLFSVIFGIFFVPLFILADHLFIFISSRRKHA